jgi:hypothetical protein
MVLKTHHSDEEHISIFSGEFKWQIVRQSANRPNCVKWEDPRKKFAYISEETLREVKQSFSIMHQCIQPNGHHLNNIFCIYYNIVIKRQRLQKHKMYMFKMKDFGFV